MATKKWGFVLLLIILLCGFMWTRTPSLLSHSVAYTYDQGRDFLKTAEMIESKKPTFIGPTTGINGLNHGPWWYYTLVFPFIFSGGSPIGFYWFNLILHFVSLFVLIRLFWQWHKLLSILIGVLIVFAPYFIGASLFVGNNIMVLPTLLLFLYCVSLLFERKKNNIVIYFLTGLLLGLVSEFELSFGFFIIPVFAFSFVIFKELRQHIQKFKNTLFLLVGFFIAFIPRTLFEIKNGFIQTKVLLSFILEPKLHNPKVFTDVFTDRLTLFYGYWSSIFPHQLWMGIFSILFLAGIIYMVYQRKKINSFLLFMLYFVIGLFTISLTYKDNFWGNYYEGIQYAMIITLGLSLLALQKNAFFHHILLVLLSTFMVVNFGMLMTKHQQSELDGLAKHETIINTVLMKTKSKPFCLRIYTPPIHPYTYSYLLKHKGLNPTSEWINGTCWFIVEADSFAQRRQDWLNTHMPKDKHTKTVTKIKDVEVQYYEVLQ